MNTSIEPVIVLHKPLGISPLDAIKLFKDTHPEYKEEKMGYAGRLDPMAEGKLLVLVGDENKRRMQYLKLDKEYEVEILAGVSTDSYDILGLIDTQKAYDPENVSVTKVKELMDTFIGTFDQVFPPFSSQPVKGKPLYYWAREGLLDTIDRPSKEREVQNVSINACETVHADELEKSIQTKLHAVQGDFRQDAIRDRWNKYFRSSPQKDFLIVKTTIRCSTGTYMRSIAHEFGEKLGIPACALSIKRTKIGSY